MVLQAGGFPRAREDRERSCQRNLPGKDSCCHLREPTRCIRQAACPRFMELSLGNASSRLQFTSPLNSVKGQTEAKTEGSCVSSALCSRKELGALGDEGLPSLGCSCLRTGYLPPSAQSNEAVSVISSAWTSEDVVHSRDPGSECHSERQGSFTCKLLLPTHTPAQS